MDHIYWPGVTAVAAMYAAFGVPAVTTAQMEDFAHVMRRPAIVFAMVGIGLAAMIAVYPRIGATFMPVMDEGSPVITIRKHATISVDEAAQTDMRIERALMTEIPEIRAIMARATPVSRTAPASFSAVEIVTPYNMPTSQ